MPCSNTTVIRRRVDVRWRLSEEDFIRTPEQQFALLRRVLELLKPGGTLVYSTCTSRGKRTRDVVERAVPELSSPALDPAIADKAAVAR